MKHEPEPRRCALTDLVLAHFLDGACDEASATEREELQLHREECMVCREALERARRLDALLAARNPLETDADRIDAWLDQALAARVPQSSSPSRLRAPLLCAAAVLILFGGVVIGHLLSVRGEPVAPAEVVPHREVVRHDALAPEPPAFVVDPLAIRGLPPPVELPDPVARRHRNFGAGRVDPVEFAWLLRTQALPVLRALGERFAPARIQAVDGLAGRLAAELVGSGRSELATETIARLPDDFRLDAMIAAATRTPEFQSALRAQVRAGDRASIDAAARIGGAELDAALAACVGGDDGRVLQITDALRSRARRPGRAALMMQIASELLSRGATPLGELALLERMFDGLGAGDAAWLASRVETSRSASDRRHALIALGVIAEPDTIPTLLRSMRAARVEEMELAAWALGRMPIGSDDHTSDLDPRRRSLLLAARASRHEPAMNGVLHSLSVTAEERAFLQAGAFTPDQVRIAARLFRDRAATSD